jgi:hypothetical protein
LSIQLATIKVLEIAYPLRRTFHKRKNRCSRSLPLIPSLYRGKDKSECGDEGGEFGGRGGGEVEAKELEELI